MAIWIGHGIHNKKGLYREILEDSLITIAVMNSLCNLLPEMILFINAPVQDDR
jgi:dihydroxyacetone kinase